MMTITTIGPTAPGTISTAERASEQVGSNAARPEAPYRDDDDDVDDDAGRQTQSSEWVRHAMRHEATPANIQARKQAGDKADTSDENERKPRGMSKQIDKTGKQARATDWTSRRVATLAGYA